MPASSRGSASALSAQLISAAGLVGQPVLNGNGEKVGRVVDLVCRSDVATYPPLAGLLVRVGLRRAFVAASDVARITRNSVTLASARVDLRDWERDSGERLLMGHIVDHQLVDVDGVRVVRASDLYLARFGTGWSLVGVDVSMRALLRRLGPASLRSRPTATRVIDWAAIQSFGAGDQPVRLASDCAALTRLRPAQLADLLEDLGQPERQELLSRLDPETAADAVEEMQDNDVRELLRDADVDTAVRLMVHMEPDEAVDALRDLDAGRRDEILTSLPDATAEELQSLLHYDEDVAAGIMTTRLLAFTVDQTVADAADAVREYLAEHGTDLTYIVVIDDEGVLVDDITLAELFVSEPDLQLARLVRPPWPVAVPANTAIDDLAEAFIDNRGSSVVVVDDERRPIGRVMADDLVDALSKRRRGLVWRKS